jgi:hypothetical protein
LAKKARVYDGTAWQELASAQTDLTGYPALATNQFGFRNKIINGDFRINQRGYVSAANLASGAYGFDRWKSNFTNTTLTFTSAPQGQSLTINSGGGIEQVIERENMPAGTYILTWTGTATGRVYNTGATPPSYAASPITVTLDGTANVEVEFTASGGTRTLQNVQLEAGSVASAFERRPIGTELALCQRYYEKSFPINFAPANGGANSFATNAGVNAFYTINGVNGAGTITFKVAKRSTPGMTPFGNSSGFWGYATSNGALTFASGAVSFQDVSDTGTRVTQQVINATFILINGHWTAEAEL